MNLWVIMLGQGMEEVWEAVPWIQGVQLMHRDVLHTHHQVDEEQQEVMASNNPPFLNLKWLQPFWVEEECPLKFTLIIQQLKTVLAWLVHLTKLLKSVNPLFQNQ